MGGGGQTDESGGADGIEADNVIRFPRDWFGSKEDLIPIGPAADRLEADAAQAADEAPAALEAGAFWTESAEEVHQPVDLPQDEDLGGLELPEEIGPLDRESTPTAVRATRAETAWDGDRRGSRLPRVGVLAFVVLIAVAIALFAVSHLGRSSAPTERRVSAAVSAPKKPATTSARPRTTKQPATQTNAASPKPVRIADPVATSGLALQRSAAADLAKFRTRELRAQELRAEQRSAAARTDASAGAQSSDSQADAPVEVSSSTPASTAAPTMSEASASSASSTSDASSGTAESSNTSSAPGPTGLGAVQGKNCSPQCH